ncbi:dihydroorotate dehydrogenase B catalytic subunit [candidate division WOR-3 bacterium JGI_Cruoil_03_44_89]|uniref:Dihydroorotate dehydrogenase n=1 Tax=candidate division WOR-3 bacterium JGI_Cruoil_03_44_89 TaxID=1973748 RepID=A0A235BYK2_UNCW3|nr:MAG: dihydroorotate dehydrogenase B catalytic subunit [candidate division WOR-3 bacterium JGI_Cruoil_03_44_89]
MDLSSKIRDVKFKNPVLLASGCFGRDTLRFTDVSELGGVITKSVTLKPREGNPPPRIFETPCGVINSIGLANPGVDGFVSDELPEILFCDTNVIASIAGEDIAEYTELARAFEQTGVLGIEVNLSCPNVEKGGLVFGKHPGTVRKIIEDVRSISSKLVIAKLPPLFENKAIVSAAEDGGADAISLINTIPALALNIDTGELEIGGVGGGLSGPAIKPVALYCVYNAIKNTNLPVIGVGGIMTAKDALEFLLLGASMVEIGTGVLVDPKIGNKVVKGIEEYFKKEGIKNIAEFQRRSRLEL